MILLQRNAILYISIESVSHLQTMRVLFDVFEEGKKNIESKKYLWNANAHSLSSYLLI